MKENNKNNKNSYIGFGFGFGLLMGALISVIIGAFTKSTLAWAFAPGLGMLIGIITGAILDSNKSK